MRLSDLYDNLHTFLKNTKFYKNYYTVRTTQESVFSKLEIIFLHFAIILFYSFLLYIIGQSDFQAKGLKREKEREERERESERERERERSKEYGS